MTEKTNLNKDDSNEEVFQKKEDSYREIKKQERTIQKSIKNIFTPKLEGEKKAKIGLESQILIGLGRTVNDVSKWKFPKIFGYQPLVSNEEFYGEVHERAMGSLQPNRFNPESLNPSMPEYPATNAIISRQRMKMYEFNGKVASILSFVLLFSAAVISVGITKAKPIVSEKYDSVKESMQPKYLASDYFNDIKDYDLTRLAIERKAAAEDGLQVKNDIVGYYILKLNKAKIESDYPSGVQIPDAVKTEYNQDTAEINRLLASIKENQSVVIKRTNDEAIARAKLTVKTKQ